MTEKKKTMSKTEVISRLAEATELSKQQVNTFFDELVKLIGENLNEPGPGVFNLPGLLKITVKRQEARPERPGINPFTKEEIMIKARPAQNVVKIRPLKRLKEVV